MKVYKIDNFPYEIHDVDTKVSEEIMKDFQGIHNGFVRVGPKGYFLHKQYVDHAAEIYNFEVRPTDVWVATYPRSGTTWTQELVWLVGNDLDYAKAAETPLVHRFPFLEHSMFFDSKELAVTLSKQKDEESRRIILDAASPAYEKVTRMPSPRYIKTHMPMSLLPPNLLDTAKVVYVARDPRDVAVSFYHHNRLITIHGYKNDFKTYWNYFLNDLIYWAPFFDHLKEAWDLRHHPNMLFLFYEELYKDLPAIIKRVSSFLGKQMTEDQITRLSDHLNIDNFKNNKSVNDDMFKEFGIILPGEEAFIRQGKAGKWHDYFDAEMTQQAENWIADNLRNTDMRFPNMNK